MRNNPSANIKKLRIFKEELDTLLKNFEKELSSVVEKLTANNANVNVNLEKITNLIEPNAEATIPTSAELSTSNAENGAIPELQGPEPSSTVLSNAAVNLPNVHPTLALPYHQKKKRGYLASYKHAKRQRKEMKLYYKNKYSKTTGSGGCQLCKNAGCANCGRGIKGGCNGCGEEALSGGAVYKSTIANTSNRII